jgi:DNA-directed RNA polymerase subunit RPC12/RpoP
MSISVCKILGHRWHPEGAEYYCVYDCMRCGHSGYEDNSWREWVNHWCWRIGRWFREHTWSARKWWRCSECGWRFGRHDDANDHIPF